MARDMAPSGDSETAVRIRVAVQETDFDVAFETRLLSGDDHDVGAVASFIGLCRGEKSRLSALELEHFPGMAERQLERICKDAGSRWPLSAITVIHRFGKLAPGDNIVLVLAGSRHRQAALDAVAFIMDFLKTDAPFWKKEHAKDGSGGQWVDAREADDAARRKWK